MWTTGDRRQRGQIAGVGQLVEHENVVALADRATNHRRTDEPRAAGDQNPHADPLLAKGVPTPSGLIYDVCTKEIVRRVRRAAACGAGVGPPRQTASQAPSSLQPGQFLEHLSPSCTDLSRRVPMSTPRRWVNSLTRALTENPLPGKPSKKMPSRRRDSIFATCPYVSCWNSPSRQRFDSAAISAAGTRNRK